MAGDFIDIEIQSEGKNYRGWYHPSEKKNEEGKPSSYHVVLDKVFFANLSYTNGKWAADEQRPEELVEAVGASIEKSMKNRGKK